MMTDQGKRRLRSQDWWDDYKEPDMTALYLERYLNYGLTRDELQSGRPIIGIAQTGSDLAPCNRHHLELASRVRDGIRDMGGIPLEFPVHPIQETGKRPTAMLDRNLQYLSLVEVLYGYPLDGVVLTTGCDKTTPALLMGAASVDIPAIVLSGGPMLNGYYGGKLAGSGTVVWHARRMLANGEIDVAQFMDMTCASAPSVGHCNTMGTASSMNTMAEALGMSLPGCAAIPGPYRERGQMAYATGRRAVEMVWEDLKPSKVLTRKAFENAIFAAAAAGASTNCPPHVIAIARHMGVELDIKDWEMGHDIPLLVNMQPAGEYLGEEFHRAGGVPAVIKELIKAGRFHTDALTVTGKTMGENHEKLPFANDRKVIRPYEDPLMPEAGLRDHQRQPVRLRGDEDLGGDRRVQAPLSRASRPSGHVRGPGDRVRGAGGLSPPDRRRLARHRRGLLPVHPQLRPGRLPGRGRGREHAAADEADREGHQGAADDRRRPAERHLGEPVDPQRLAGSGDRRQPRHRPDRRHGAARPAQPPPRSADSAARRSRSARPR